MIEFEAIGTHWSIEMPEKEHTPEVHAAIQRRIAEFDATYSRFRADSVVSQAAKIKGEYVFPEDAVPLIKLYRTLYDFTGGAFTPLIGRTLEQAGYDAEYSLKPGEVLKPPSWDEVMEWDGRTVHMKQPALLDFGAVGKGYIVDIVSELIESYGITEYIVDAGGDIRQRGKAALGVGLEHPGNAKQVIGIANILNQSICASAGNRRAWQGFHHIIDPRTLKSPEEIIATWVIAETTMVADGLATCLFFSAPETFVPHFSFEYLILYKDYSIKRSNGFPAELFLANS